MGNEAGVQGFSAGARIGGLMMAQLPSSDEERCFAEAALADRKAFEADDDTTRKTWLEIAARWRGLASDIRDFAG